MAVTGVAKSTIANFLVAAGVAALLLAAITWNYWSALQAMADRWMREEEYTHGWLVPLFAFVILGLRLNQLGLSAADVERTRTGTYCGGLLLAAGALSWSMGGQPLVATVGMGLSLVGASVLIGNWISVTRPQLLSPSVAGLVLMGLAGAARVAGAYFSMEWIDSVSLLPFIAGAVLAAGGTRLLSWSWPAITYLIFMIPLPYRVEVALRQPLRELATTASTYTLQTIGLPAYAQGTSVIVNDVHLDIVGACSGLRMLMIFFALAFAVAILSGRPLLQRLILVVSAVPIAIISNVIRITATGLLYLTPYHELAGQLFHDLAGWFMMPIALVMLGMELWYLDRLIVVEHKAPITFGLNPAGTAANLSKSDADVSKVAVSH